MSILFLNSPASAVWGEKPKTLTSPPSFRKRIGALRVKSFFFNPIDEPVLKEALKEPVAFMGGIFAGLLRLNLNDDPLKEWVTRTVEASGITEEDINADGSKPEEEVPQQIDIE